MKMCNVTKKFTSDGTCTDCYVSESHTFQAIYTEGKKKTFQPHQNFPRPWCNRIGLHWQRSSFTACQQATTHKAIIDQRKKINRESTSTTYTRTKMISFVIRHLLSLYHWCCLLHSNVLFVFVLLSVCVLLSARCLVEILVPFCVFCSCVCFVVCAGNCLYVYHTNGLMYLYFSLLFLFSEQSDH